MGSTDKNARAVHRISLLTRGEDGKVVLPVGPIHGVTLESLGAVQPPGAPGFPLGGVHPARGVPHHPPVHALRRSERSSHEVGSRDCSRRGRRRGKPLFRLTADEGLDEPIVAKSATAAWAEVLRRVTTVREWQTGRQRRRPSAGPSSSAARSPTSAFSVEELPGVNDCTQIQASAGAGRDCRR